MDLYHKKMTAEYVTSNTMLAFRINHQFSGTNSAQSTCKVGMNSASSGGPTLTASRNTSSQFMIKLGAKMNN